LRGRPLSWRDGGRYEGDATWIGPHLGANGGVSVRDGVTAMRADVNGALIFMRGSVYTTHDPGGAVTLVETGDPGVRIYRENRQVAVSDRDGEALLTGLNPYAPNHIAVESRDCSFDALIEKTDALVVPRKNSGTTVSFAPKSHHPFLAIVTRGIPIQTPLGATVTLDGEAGPFIVGHDGQVFIADLKRQTGADIDLGTSRCRIYIRPEYGKGALPHTDPLLCLRETSVAY